MTSAVRTTNMVGLLAALALTGCGGEPPREPAPRSVAWIEVGADRGGGLSWAPARIEAGDRSVVAFDLPGTVTMMRKRVGDSFRRGELLARIEQRTYALERLRAEAQLSETRARLQRAEADAVRKTTLLKEGATSQLAFEDAVSTRDSLRQLVNAQRASVGVAEETVQDTLLIAPFAGRIAERLVEPGRRLSAGEAVYAIDGSEGGLEAVFSVSRARRDALETGARIYVRQEELERGPATVTEIASRADAGGFYEVRARLAEEDSFRPGAAVEVGLSRAEAADAVAIPLSAFIATDSGVGKVYLVDPQTETVSARLVRLGAVNEDSIEITSGIDPGAVLVARGVEFLSEGQKVHRLGTGAERYGE